MKFVLYLLVALLAFVCSATKGKQQLAAFWGDNSSKDEQRLRFYCELNVYDVIIVSDLSSNAKTTNKDDLPSLTFANHCNDNPISLTYNVYLKCPQIEQDIRYCQDIKGIKIILNVGQSSLWIGWSKKEAAIQDANLWWNLFLGGSYDVRTFGSVVLDGINLALKGTQQIHIIDFVREMRRIMDVNNQTKQYMLTASPECGNRDEHASYFKEIFDKVPTAFNELFVSFSQPNCAPLLSNVDQFNSTLQKWFALSAEDENPKVYIGLSANKIGNNRNFVPLEELQIVVNDFTSKYPKIQGIILDDAGDDSLQKIRGAYYSKHIRCIFDDPACNVSTIITPPPTQPTQPTQPPQTTQPGKKCISVGVLRCLGTCLQCNIIAILVAAVVAVCSSFQ